MAVAVVVVGRSNSTITKSRSRMQTLYVDTSMSSPSVDSQQYECEKFKDIWRKEFLQGDTQLTMVIFFLQQQTFPVVSWVSGKKLGFP